MLHEHKHEHCPHLNVKYCLHCDVVYCKDCGREWGTKYYYYPYTIPYWGNITTMPSTIGGYTYTNTNGEVQVTCNHT